jgi:ribonuclease HI
VKNKEYWIQLDGLASKLPIEWKWVKGHAGIELNERCDALVRKEMDTLLES